MFCKRRSISQLLTCRYVDSSFSKICQFLTKILFLHLCRAFLKYRFLSSQWSFSVELFILVWLQGPYMRLGPMNWQNDAFIFKESTRSSLSKKFLFFINSWNFSNGERYPNIYIPMLFRRKNDSNQIIFFRSSLYLNWLFKNISFFLCDL